jgi:hypothetical protein
MYQRYDAMSEARKMEKLLVEMPVPALGESAATLQQSA